MSDNHRLDLFVPGRLCLFGEHSDWSGAYRRMNADIDPGRTIVTGTNQGLYATVARHENKLIYERVKPNGERVGFECPMEETELLRLAREGGFWSYIAGVAYQALVHYHVAGIHIVNERTDLPIKKGLSSSAAVSVLVARGFNRIYSLNLTTRGEMDLAYRGEVTTPSRCGRMDQACAYGSTPVLMTYDGDYIEVNPVAAGADLHLLIVDLGGRKDTIRILRDLNSAYPFASTKEQMAAQHYLGPLNAAIVDDAINAIGRGDAPALGELMKRAQAEFDEHLSPLCPSELTAPLLHGLLEDGALAEHVYGGKGVGSQGDGSAQFVCRGTEARERAAEMLSSEYGMVSYPLDIPAGGAA